jgi:alpha-N-arabinofuranosidase
LLGANDAATVTVHIDQHQGSIDPRIFGHYTEDTLSSYEGGVLSEMLYNRKFEMPEERDIKNFLFVGTSSGWEPLGLSSGVTLVLDDRVYYSPSQSERIAFSGGSIPAGIQQKGYQVVPPHMSTFQRVSNPFRFRPGERYRVRLAIKNRDLAGSVFVALGESYHSPVAQHAFNFSGSEDWRVYECELTPTGETADGRFMIYINSPGTVWVDSVSLVREDLDEGGFRKDVLEATKRFKPTSLRWPGGWFVSDYHWQDGIGSVDKRPARLNRAWMAYTSNDVGIDECVELCRKLNAEPYICVNVGSGSPEEAAALVEYANGGPNTPYGRLRAANGHPEPYRIRTWNVGNEEYLPTLGATRGQVYAKTFQAYAQAMRAVDPSIELVAVGAFDIPSGIIPPENPAYGIIRYLFDWDKEVLPIAGSDMTAYSIHHYAPEDAVAGWSAQDINRAAMVKAEDLGAKLDHLHEQMAEYVPDHRRLPIALDEWAMWLPKDLPPGASVPPPAGIKDPSEIGLYGSLQSLREALAEAGVYNLMQRRPKDFALTSRTILYAYALGLVGIGRDQVVSSPPALSLELYSTYDHCDSLGVEVKGPTFDVGAVKSFKGAHAANLLDVSARQSSDGKTLETFVVNRDLDNPMEASVRFSGKHVANAAQLATLTAASLLEWNSFDHPDRVKIQFSQLPIHDGQLQVTLPAHSISKLKLGVE